jgi:hypothetical protein
MIAAADRPALVLADAVAPDNDVAEAIHLPPPFVVAVLFAPSRAALPASFSASVPVAISVLIPVLVPPIAIIPIPIHPGLCGNTPGETTCEEASCDCNR